MDRLGFLRVLISTVRILDVLGEGVQRTRKLRS